MLQNLQRVEEELQSSAAPPVPLRPAASGAVAVGGVDSSMGVEDGEEQYLELQAGEMDECEYEIEPAVRQRLVLPGQVSMPESSLPPALIPRKQSCPEVVASVRRPTPVRPLPQTPEEPAKSTDGTKRKPADRPRPPPVAARKK